MHIRNKLPLILTFSLFALPFGVTNAITLGDGNSQFVIDTAGGGITTFEVDGVNHFWEQDFLYDITHENGQQLQAPGFEEIGMFDDGGGFYGTPDTTSLSGTNGVTLTYVLASLTIDVSFLLTGGAFGSDNALIAETYQITNTSGGELTLNLFAYTDIDLGGSFTSSGNDQGEVLTDTIIPFTAFRQFDTDMGLQMIARTTTSDGVDQPSNWMVGTGDGFTGTVRVQLYDTTDTYLDNSIATGPADLQMAAEFVRTLANGESFSYTQSLELSSTVPVPSAVWLFGSGLLGLIGISRRKKV